MSISEAEFKARVLKEMKHDDTSSGFLVKVLYATTLFSVFLLVFVPLLLIVYVFATEILNQLLSIISMAFLLFKMNESPDYVALQLLSQICWIMYSPPIIAFCISFALKMISFFFNVISDQLFDLDYHRQYISKVRKWLIGDKKEEKRVENELINETRPEISKIKETLFYMLKETNKEKDMQKTSLIVFAGLVASYVICLVLWIFNKADISKILIVYTCLYLLCPAIGFIDCNLRAWRNIIVLILYRKKNKERIKTIKKLTEKMLKMEEQFKLDRKLHMIGLYKNPDTEEHRGKMRDLEMDIKTEKEAMSSIKFPDLCATTTSIIKNLYGFHVLKMLYPRKMIGQDDFSIAIQNNTPQLIEFPFLTLFALIIGISSKFILWFNDIGVHNANSYYPYSIFIVIFYIFASPYILILAHFCGTYSFAKLPEREQARKDKEIELVNEMFENVYFTYSTVDFDVPGFSNIKLLCCCTESCVSDSLARSPSIEPQMLCDIKGLKYCSRKRCLKDNYDPLRTAFEQNVIEKVNKKKNMGNFDDVEDEEEDEEEENKNEEKHEEEEDEIQIKPKEEKTMTFKLEELIGKGNIGMATTLTKALYVLLTVFIIISGICIYYWSAPIENIYNSKIFLPSLAQKGYYDPPSINNTMCTMGVNGLSIAELAALPLLSYYANDGISLDVRRHNIELIIDLAFTRTKTRSMYFDMDEMHCANKKECSKVESHDIATVVRVYKNNELDYNILIPYGIRDKGDCIPLIEMFMQEVPDRILGEIIPFYDFFMEIFGNIIFQVSSGLQKICGVRSITFKHALRILDVAKKLPGDHNIAVGQSIGGYFSKYIGYMLRQNFTAFGFDSLSFQNNALCGDYSGKEDEFFSIINVYANSGLFESAEDIPFNYVHADYDFGLLTQFRPPNATDAFCHAVAECSTEQMHIDFCDKMLGHETFKNVMENIFQRKWNENEDI